MKQLFDWNSIQEQEEDHIDRLKKAGSVSRLNTKPGMILREKNIPLSSKQSTNLRNGERTHC